MPGTDISSKAVRFCSADEVDEAHSVVTRAFASGQTQPLSWRLRQIKKIWWMLEDNKERIAEALHKDLHKHKLEALSADVYGIQTVCVYTLRHLKAWAADEKPSRFNALNLFGRARIRKEPKGSVLVISAWNFPFQELIEPLIAAIAAGCSAVVKPSEVAVASQNLIMEMIPKYLDHDTIRVVTGGPQEMGHILDKKWDHIFYTGSTRVGTIIYQKAASHLTSVTLELGGQGPAIVTANADVDLAARRIAGAKLLNAGQVCLSVNHVFVDPSIKGQFIASLVRYFDEFTDGVKHPECYSHIANERNFSRLGKLLDQTGGKVVYGGHRDITALAFSPTVVTDVLPSDSLMSEELFGPILPVLDATLDNAISYTTSHGHPLALYLFSNSQAEKERTLKQTRSGGVTINDCIVHNLTQGTPFGGTGASGMGAFHGPYGFLEFTHLRTVADVPKWLDFILKNRYPPYTDKKTSALLKIVRPVQTVSFDRDGNDVRGLAHQARAIIKVLMLGGLLYGIGTNSRALADPLQLGQSMLGLAGRIYGKP